MSAIYGLLHLSEQPVEAHDLEQMSASMASLGPDAHRIWVNGPVGLGSRLMPFTPADIYEQQPLLSHDRSLVLICNARIDNRVEMTAKLGIAGNDAELLPDSAFILHAYQKWGEHCVQHLIGDYSFALWDQRQQHFTLARSPVGGRPLYYHATNKLFAFSTVPKGLFTLSSIPRELDHERIADYLVQAPIAQGKTFYRGLQRLQTGHLLTVGREGLRLRKFWQDCPPREIRYSADGDYVDAFNELFKRVIADHLRSTSPVGVMMSGGLDSTSVAAVAATQLKSRGRRLCAFTEVPGSGCSGMTGAGRYADETPFVRAMSQRYDNIDLNLITTDGMMYLDGLYTFFDAANIPFRNATNRTWIEAILQAAGKQGVRVLLTGAQGNLTISRNGQGLLPLLIRQGKWLRALQEARALGGSSTFRTFFGQGIMPLLPTALYDAMQQMRGNRAMGGLSPWYEYSVINPDFARIHRVEERAQENGFEFSFRPDADILKTTCRILPRLSMMANDISHVYRGLYGTDVRDPTADVRIAEFCLAIPEEQYLKDGVSRRLVRRAMAEMLPAEILENRQRGLQAADWFQRLLLSREKLLLELSEWGKNDLLSGILDLKRMVRLLENMPYVQGDPTKIMREYRQLLEFGFMIGRFILWFENYDDVHA